MHNVIVKFLSAAFTVGLLVCFVAEKTSAQSIPSGTYQNTCDTIATKGAVLTAYCKTKTPGQSTLSKVLGAGAQFKSANLTSLDAYYECEGDISNNDGNLQCSRNPDSVLMKKAKAAIRRTARYVIGGVEPSDSTLSSYVRLMFSHNLQAKFFASKYKAAGGDPELIAMFNKEISTNTELKSKVIQNGYEEAYGRGPGPEQIASYLNDSSVIHKGIVVNAERKLMKDDYSNLVRGIAIFNAYKDTMGRPPTAGDRQYWNPRIATYKEIAEASRAYLYSPNGAKDLLETIKRALEDKNGKEPDSEQVNKPLILYSQKKAIYDEMK